MDIVGSLIFGGIMGGIATSFSWAKHGRVDVSETICAFLFFSILGFLCRKHK
jgi:hypothetical protein